MSKFKPLPRPCRVCGRKFKPKPKQGKCHIKVCNACKHDIAVEKKRKFREARGWE